jgi:hypothetical protein
VGFAGGSRKMASFSSAELHQVPFAMIHRQQCQTSAIQLTI